MENIDPQGMTMAVSVDSGYKPTAKPSTVIIKKSNNAEIIPWGDDNQLPQEILADIRLHPSLQSILYQKGRLLYGVGCFLGKVSDEQNGFEKIVPLRDEKIQNWLKRANFEQKIAAACLRHYRLENHFPEFILTKNKKEVFTVNYLKAALCRYASQNSKGIIDSLIYANKWSGNKPDGGNPIPVLDELDPIEHLKSVGYKAVFRAIGLDSEDSVGYRELSWNAIRTSNWLEVAKEIPNFKASLFVNQANVKYHFQTTTEWWNWKYKGFSEKTAEERLKIMRNEQKQLEKTISGTPGAGKSILSTGTFNKHTGEIIPGWKIDTINNKFGSADYIEDMQEATSQILTALNIPATLVGQSFGKKMGAGSGSDIREAYNLYMGMQEIERDILLEPWYKAFEYNGWSDEIRLVFRYPQITTLDTHSETKLTDYSNE